MDRTLEALDQVGEELDPAEFREFSAGALLDRSEILTELGQPARARADADQAVALLKSPAMDEPVLLAMALTDHGVASAELHQLDAAERDFQEALNALRLIPSPANVDADAQVQKSATLNQWALMLGRDVKRRQEARNCFDESVRILEPIISKFRQYPSFRLELARAHLGRADLSLLTGQINDAKPDCDAARQLVDELLRASPENAEYLSLAAQAWSLASRTEADAGSSQQRRTLITAAIGFLERALAIDNERAIDRAMLDHLRAKMGSTD
jgi:tetratricopeptide (TPR) repeat protein